MTSIENKTPTLVVISPGFPKDESDTTCLPAVQSIIRTLKDQYPNTNIIIVSMDYPPEKKRYWWNGVEVISLNGDRFSKWLKPFFWVMTIKVLFNISNANNVVAVLSLWCGQTALVGKVFTRLKKIPFLIWIQGQDAKKNNRYVRLIRPRSEELLAISEFSQTEFHDNHGVKPLRIIPNGINPSFHQSTNLQRSIDVLGAGSLIPLKRFDVFMDVVSRIRAVRKEPVKAAIAGGGPESDALKQLATQLNLDIDLFGEVSHQEVLKSMSMAKVFLHPSSYEGYSTVCLEALYHGCHVVSFWAPGKEIIPHWHVVSSADEMVHRCHQLLESEHDFSSVLVHDLSSVAKNLMDAFRIQANFNRSTV